MKNSHTDTGNSLHWKLLSAIKLVQAYYILLTVHIFYFYLFSLTAKGNTNNLHL